MGIPRAWLSLRRYSNAKLRQIEVMQYVPGSTRALRKPAHDILAYRICIELGL